MSKKHKHRKHGQGEALQQPSTPAVYTSGVSRCPALSAMEKRALFVLIGAAFVLRLWRLGRADLWQDEMIFVAILSTPDAGPIETWGRYWQYLISMGQMPLAGVLQNMYIGVSAALGWEEPVRQAALMRYPAVVLGTLAVPGIFWAGRRLGGAWVGWLAAIWMTVAFYPVFYSREAYCYAHVLFFSAWAWAAWLRFLDEGGAKAFWLAAVCFTGLALSHMGALVAVGSWGGIAGLAWLAALARKEPRAVRVRWGWMICAPGLAVLAASPYLLHFMLNNTAHIGAGTHPGFWFILNDALNKMFLGDRAGLPVLAWGTVFLGLAGLYRSRGGAWLTKPVLLAASFLAAFLILALATMNTQYISSRYFSPLFVLFALVTAQGLWTGAGWCARTADASRKSTWQRRMAVTAVCVLGLVHLAVFLPPLYRLNAKSVDFRGIAEWLNENLEPGTPYVMESAYELRFVSGYYPTPDRLAAAPYVHGSGPEETARLRQYQRAFLERFPEAVFVRSAWDGYQRPAGLWTWPDTHYQQQAELRDDALRALVQMGIYPNFFRSELTPHTFTVRLHYNTMADVEERLLREGVPVRFDYSGWTPQRVAQGLYVRAQPGARGRVVAVNWSDQPVRGKITLEGAVISSAATVAVSAELDGRGLQSGQVNANALWAMEMNDVELAPGKQILEWGAIPRDRHQVQALFVHHMTFTPEED